MIADVTAWVKRARRPYAKESELTAISGSKRQISTLLASAVGLV